MDDIELFSTTYTINFRMLVHTLFLFKDRSHSFVSGVVCVCVCVSEWVCAEVQMARILATKVIKYAQRQPQQTTTTTR